MRWKQTEYAGWGMTLRANGQLGRPERVSGLGDMIGPAIGNRRSYGDTMLNSDGYAVDMTRLDRFIAFDPESGLLDAEAGVSIADILATFGPQGFMPAVLPGTGFVTLGGAIANDVHGKNHQTAGSFGQHVKSIQLMAPDGKTQRVSAKRNAKLFRATLGGLGQTGVIVSARIHLARCIGGTMTVHEQRIDDLDGFFDAFETSTAPYQVGWIDMTASGVNLGRGILEEGHPDDGPFAKPRNPRSVPFNMPGFAMSQPIVKAFNALYRRRIPENGRDRTRPLTDFFFPLDRILNWNRLYGKRGFHQFQCVLPDETAHETLPLMLAEIVNAGLASPLSVIKRMGAGRGGPMSFPMQGYTLAVDIVNRKTTAILLARLNDMTKTAGGRVYLAKDSSLTAASLPCMYPELDDFRTICNGTDPDHVLETDLTRRLNLRAKS